MASTIVQSPTSAPASRWIVARPAATPTARVWVVPGPSAALAMSRNHIPKSGPLVPPVFRNPFDTAKKTPAYVWGSSASTNPGGPAQRRGQVGAEVAVAGLPVEVGEQRCLLGEGLLEATDPAADGRPVEDGSGLLVAGCARRGHGRAPHQVSAGVRTGASQRRSSSSSARTRVMESPFMSREVT